VQRVGLQRLAVIFFRHSREHAGTRNIDGNRSQHHGQRPHRDLDLRVMESQPPHRLPHDPRAGEQQQQGFAQRREVLDLAVPVEVRTVGGPSGETHGEKGQAGGHQVQAGMRRLGQDSQASGPHPHHEF
jgi:hypothetical protein